MKLRYNTLQLKKSHDLANQQTELSHLSDAVKFIILILLLHNNIK